MLMTPSRSALPDHQGTGSYTAPTDIKSVRLRDLLYEVKRGPMFSTHQLDIFKENSVEPDDQTLYCAGDLALLARPCVSIVGSRQATPHGRSRAARLAREIIERGVVVVSGLAKGIDTAAQTTTVERGGQTVAVIGTPLSRVTPVENGSLQETIWRGHLLVSPFAEGTQVLRSNFPKRNAVMAAISDATVIVEAEDNSGTLHQAVACQRLGRWLFILKSVVDTKAWPKRFLHIKNTQVLEHTEQIFDALKIQ